MRGALGGEAALEGEVVYYVATQMRDPHPRLMESGKAFQERTSALRPERGGERKSSGIKGIELEWGQFQA